MLFYDEFEFIVTPFFCTIIFGSLPELFPRSARIMDLESNLRTADMLIAQSFCQGVGVKNRIATLAPVLLISLTIWACSGSDATTDGHIRPVTRSTLSPVPVQLDTGVISAGDSIVVSVWDAPQFDTHTSVRFNGAITLPFVGEIEVAGNRKDELARMLRQRLSEYVKGNISLTVEVFAPSPKISVFGMVARQGSFPANTSLSLVDALIIGVVRSHGHGGLTRQRGGVSLFREDRRAAPLGFCANDHLAGGFHDDLLAHCRVCRAADRAREAD